MRFLVGSQNFGLDLLGSDKDYIEFYFPSVGDLCKPISRTKECQQTDGSLIKRIDIRAIPSLFYKANLDILQLLFSKEVFNGGEVEKYFQNYEEEISTLNLPRLYQSVMGSALNRFKRGTSKDLAHIIFGFKLLVKFEELGFKNLRSCFEHNDQKLYQDIRNETYKPWFDSAKSLEQLALEKKESYMSQFPNDGFKTKMENDIGNFIIQNFEKRRLYERSDFKLNILR